MRAFVKVNNGTFPNLNFYMAWEGFNTMGYSVTLFEEKDIPNLDITRETPVFAGVKVFRDIMNKLGVQYPDFDCYPKVLEGHYGRTFTKSTLGEVKAGYHRGEKPVFVKPVKPKVFTGVVLNSLLNLIPIAAVPDDTEVWVCEPLPPILSEYRAYIHDGDILGVKHYFGDWSIVPNKRIVENVVKTYKPCPIAYGVDFGIIPFQGEYLTMVLEANDGCNLGNYGIDSIHYGEMIVSRWFEIMGGHIATNQINAEIEYFKDNKYSQESGNLDYMKSDRCKEYRTKEVAQQLITNSMKAFAKGVQENLNNEAS